MVPQEGKDETFDTIMEEIGGLEEELEEALKRLQKQTKYVAMLTVDLTRVSTYVSEAKSPIGIVPKERRYMFQTTYPD